MKKIYERIILCYEYGSQDEAILHQKKMNKDGYTIEKKKTKSNDNKIIWYGKNKEIEKTIDLKSIVLKATEDIDNKYTDIVNEFLADTAKNIENIAKVSAEQGRKCFVIVDGNKCEIPTLMGKNKIEKILSNAPNYQLIVKKILDMGCRNVEIIYDINFNPKFKLKCNII